MEEMLKAVEMENEAIEFGAGPEGPTSTTRLNQIKNNLVAGLVKVGMPGSLHVYVSSKALTLDDAQALGLTFAGEGHAIISQNDGRVMYNIGGKLTVGHAECRINGNIMLPKGQFTVKAETFKAYKQAKEEQKQAREANKAKMTEDELSAGESVA